jgi:uncharacterized protein (DUF427 family)
MTTRARGRVRVEDGQKRVRVYLGGELVADTKNAKYVWEKPYYPTYYLPAEDVNTDLLIGTGETHRTPSRGVSGVYTVKAGNKEATGAARWYTESPIEEINGHISLNWKAMDAWFEEDEQVYVHPRDPYTRIDILQSSRHVEVFIDGTKIADTHKPRLLFETGLPVRYYIPKTDVRLDLLEPSELTTDCPYKGTANYYSVDVDGSRHENVVWWYQHPVHESARIAGYVSFYNEKVDIYVDGALQNRPKTVFS